jgi:hypothetical protein
MKGNKDKGRVRDGSAFTFVPFTISIVKPQSLDIAQID